VKHAVWVWAFSEDGRDPAIVRDALAAHGFDVIFKTHDGTEWTTRADGNGVAGPEDVRKWADFFEAAGVGYHAWCVVRGNDPMREAQMAAEALSSGARSMYFDLETPEGKHYWHGTNEGALAFGAELRRLQPNARLICAPDGRPWKVKEVPVAQFATFCDGMAPQLYWELFDSPANYKLLADYGYVAGPEGMTPELILNSANGALSKFGRPILPIGGGAARVDEWQRFVNHAYSLGMPSVSVWRYGTATSALFPTLQSMPPAQPPPPPPPEPAPAVAVAPVAPTPVASPTPAPTASPAPEPTKTPEPKRQQEEPKPEEKQDEEVEALTTTSRRSETRLSNLWRTLGSDRPRR
jgi:hypothetical protein